MKRRLLLPSTLTVRDESPRPPARECAPDPGRGRLRSPRCTRGRPAVCVQLDPTALALPLLGGARRLQPLSMRPDEMRGDLIFSSRLSTPFLLRQLEDDRFCMSCARSARPGTRRRASYGPSAHPYAVEDLRVRSIRATASWIRRPSANVVTACPAWIALSSSRRLVENSTLSPDPDDRASSRSFLAGRGLRSGGVPPRSGPPA